MGVTPFVPALILGAVAFYLGARGYVRAFLYYVPASLLITSAIIWFTFAIAPVESVVFMALLAMGLFLCAGFGMGLVIHRAMSR